MRSMTVVVDDAYMTVSEEIVTLDDVAATLRALASGAVRFDPEVVDMLADHVSRAADHAQEVADLRAALALLSPRA
jgi:hypothetical protein